MRPIAAIAAIALLASCGAKTGLEGPPPCDVDDDCPPAMLFCGSVPTCIDAHCAVGPVRDCDDETACTDDACDEAARACTHAPRDRDRDGFVDRACGGDDCDDSDAAVHPGAAERCSGGIDEDCDAWTDCSDSDCFADPRCAMCPRELCTGGRDEDCDTEIDCDDSDCVSSLACCADRETICDDGRDDDCDGPIDCLDTDCALSRACCAASAETCDGMDEDCDGVVDDGVPCFFADGMPIEALATTACGAVWYSYGADEASARPVPDFRVSSRVAIAVVASPSSCGGAAVALIADQVRDGSGGMLRATFDVTPRGAGGLLVSDDPGECSYDASVARGQCAWEWQPCCTDGVMIGPFGVDFCVDVTLATPSGVTSVVVIDGPTDTIPRSFSTPIEICARTIPAVP